MRDIFESEVTDSMIEVWKENISALLLIGILPLGYAIIAFLFNDPTWMVGAGAVLFIGFTGILVSISVIFWIFTLNTIPKYIPNKDKLVHLLYDHPRAIYGIGVAMFTLIVIVATYTAYMLPADAQITFNNPNTESVVILPIKETLYFFVAIPSLLILRMWYNFVTGNIE